MFFSCIQNTTAITAIKNVFKNIDVNNRNKILELSLNEDVFCYDFEFMDTIISLLPKLNLGIDKKKNNK